MHMWDESIASRGSHEVGSCLLSHFKEMRTSTTRLILCSDACGARIGRPGVFVDVRSSQ